MLRLSTAATVAARSRSRLRSWNRVNSHFQKACTNSNTPTTTARFLNSFPVADQDGASHEVDERRTHSRIHQPVRIGGREGDMSTRPRLDETKKKNAVLEPFSTTRRTNNIRGGKWSGLPTQRPPPPPVSFSPSSDQLKNDILKNFFAKGTRTDATKRQQEQVAPAGRTDLPRFRSWDPRSKDAIRPAGPSTPLPPSAPSKSTTSRPVLGSNRTGVTKPSLLANNNDPTARSSVSFSKQEDPVAALRQMLQNTVPKNEPTQFSSSLRRPSLPLDERKPQQKMIREDLFTDISVLREALFGNKNRQQPKSNNANASPSISAQSRTPAWNTAPLREASTPSSSSSSSSSSSTDFTNNNPTARSSVSLDSKQEGPLAALRQILQNTVPKNKPTQFSSSQQQQKMIQEDLTDISVLRDALFGNKNGQQPKSNNANASPSISAQSRTPAWNTAPLRKASTPSSLSSSSSSSTDFTSPLSDFIRKIQHEQAERAKQNEKNKLDLLGIDMDQTPLPQWRLTNDRHRFRDMRQRQRRDKDDYMNMRQSEWGQEEHEKTKRPVFVGPEQQVVTLPFYDVSLAEASLIFREKSWKIRKILRSLGLLRRNNNNNNQSDNEIVIDVDAMELIALELDKKFERQTRRAVQNDEEILLQRRAAAEEEEVVVGNDNKTTTPYESLPPRPPVVCIMGHVDHGKTTLMDALRRRSQESAGGTNKKSKKGSKKVKEAQKSNDVAGTEAGGITQVISAFQVPLAGQQQETVTFLDTPGHAAFREMRRSGSDAADIIVLVIAADDGVSAQTVEILDFYKSLVNGAGSGGISLVVAMNKIDKPGVDAEESRYRIESQLLEHGIIVEGMSSSSDGAFGPPAQLIPVSGLTGEGLDDLVEGLALQSEIMDLRVDEKARAEGVVMDARVDKGLGIVADCIVRWGSVKKGDVVVSGLSTGKVRILKDMNDNPLKKGLPSQPIRIVGFDSVPKAGDPIICVESEEHAEELINHRRALMASNNEDPISTSYTNDMELQSAGKHMMHVDWRESLEKKYGLEEEGVAPPIRIPVVIRADADGSLAAIRHALVQIGVESRRNIVVEPVNVGVGPVLANDIRAAKEGGATIISFNVKNEYTIEKLAEEEDVQLIGGNVIYSLLDDAKKEFASYLPLEPVEVVHGRATVQALYDIGGIDEKVAGLRVIEGTLFKDKAKGTEGTVSCRFRIIRDGKTVPTSDLRATTLKHFKDEVDEIGRGKECGLALSGHSDFETGDIIECFSVEMRREFL